MSDAAEPLLEPLLDALRSEWQYLLIAAIEKIEHCLEQLNAEQICARPGPGLNSIANQLAHIAGNLQQWSVAGFGLEPDRRDRDREFADWEPSDLRRLNQELIMALNEASQVIARLTASQLLHTRNIQGFQVTGLQALSHTVTHLVGHTHQIVQLTRWHLGPGYRFDWSEDGPRDNVPL